MPNSAEHEVHARICLRLHNMQRQGYCHCQYGLFMHMVAEEEAAEGSIGYSWQKQAGVRSAPQGQEARHHC